MRPARLQLLVFIVLTSLGITLIWGEITTWALVISLIGADGLPLLLVYSALIHLVFLNTYLHFNRRFHGQGLLSLLCLGGAVGVFIGLRLESLSRYNATILFFLLQRFITAVFAHYSRQFLQRVATEKSISIGVLLPSRAAVGMLLVGGALLAPQLSEHTFLYGWIVSLVATGVLLMAADQVIPQGQSDTIETVKIIRIENLRALFRGGLIRWLTFSAISVTFLLGLILYQSAAVLEKYYENSVELIAFLAAVHGFGYWLTLPLQHQRVTRLLGQFNAGNLNLIYPAIFNLVFVAIVLLPASLIAGLAEMTRRAMYQAIYEPLERLLYGALPGGAEGWARRLNEGYMQPMGVLLAAGALSIATLDLIPADIFLLMAGVLVGGVFLVAAQRVGFLYGQSLASSLQAGKYWSLRQSAGDIYLTEGRLVEQLIHEMRAGKVETRDLLLRGEIIAESGIKEGYTALRAVWEKSDPSLQAELLPLVIKAAVTREQQVTNRSLIQSALASENSQLRYAALNVIESSPHLDVKFRVASLLIDPDPNVNIVAASVLLRHPAESIRVAALAQLRWLSKDERAAIRVKAVNALVKGCLNRFHEVVMPLDVPLYLVDPATYVRQAILPAATIEQLLEAACDLSPAVREASHHVLREHLFFGVRESIFAALKKNDRAEKETGFWQVRAQRNHWHLLAALESVRKRDGRRLLKKELSEGFQQIEILDMLIETLSGLRQESFLPLVQELHHEREALLQSMVDFLGLVAGKERVRAIVWTLKESGHLAEEEKARHALRNLTNAEIEQQIFDCLKGLAGEKRQLSLLPVMALRILLAQTHSWYPMLTLSALSRLPETFYRHWVDAETIAQVLERNRHSAIEGVHETVQELRRYFVPTQTPTEQGKRDVRNLRPQDESEITMLSTLERMIFLRNVTLFAQLQLDELRVLARVCEEKAFAEGQQIIRQDEISEDLYIVVEGTIRIERHVPGKNEPVVITTLGPQEVFGEITLLVGGPRTADAVAATPALLLSVTRNALTDTLENNPSIAMAMLRAMAERVRNSTTAFDQYMHGTLTQTLAQEISQEAVIT